MSIGHILRIAVVCSSAATADLDHIVNINLEVRLYSLRLGNSRVTPRQSRDVNKIIRLGNCAR